MSRRLIASLSAVLCALLAVTAVALASGGGSGDSGTRTAASAPAATTGATAPAAARRGAHRFGGHHGMLRLLRGVLLKSGAERLGVTPAELQKAVKAVAEEQFAKKAAEAKLTAAEIAALRACRKGHRGFRQGGTAPAGCDRAAAKAGIAKLKALPKPDLAALRTELSGALGAKLGVSGAKVLEAARAELSDRLDQAVKAGFLDAAARTKVLACFDAPGSCDLKALKASILKGHMRTFGQRRGHGGRKHGRRGASLRGAHA